MDSHTVNKYDTLLVQIVDYVYHGDISKDDQAFNMARFSLLDALGCASESLATNQDVHKLIGHYVLGTVVPNGFRLPGTGLTLDPVKGAFDFSVLIRYLDHNDGFTGLEWGHPSDTLGAICAVADYVSRAEKKAVTIDDLLAALIKSYEIQGRLQLANSLNQRGLDHVFFEQLACCAVISGPSFLGLAQEQALAALSFCILDNAPLRTYRHAQTRSHGKAGPAQALELGGPQPAQFGTYVIKNVFYKLMPCEGHSLTAVEACVRIRQDWDKRGVAWDVNKVARVNVRTHNGAVLIISKPASMRLANAADRDHCLEFMMALALLKGSPPEYGDYSDESPWAKDERIDFLRQRFVVVEDEKFSADYHDPAVRSMASAVSIELLDGTKSDEVIIEFPLGNPKHDGTQRTVKEKVIKNLRLTYDEDTVDAVIQMIETQKEARATALFEILWKGDEKNGL
ncbi:MmgE/PrpD family-domain-containing protein [Penicillium chermesinum]|nr:MmgE/PrpD family-domain-containing protein [Penicillium chermesinum]